MLVVLGSGGGVEDGVGGELEQKVMMSSTVARVELSITPGVGRCWQSPG